MLLVDNNFVLPLLKAPGLFSPSDSSLVVDNILCVDPARTQCDPILNNITGKVNIDCS